MRVIASELAEERAKGKTLNQISYEFGLDIKRVERELKAYERRKAKTLPAPSGEWDEVLKLIEDKVAEAYVAGYNEGIKSSH